jgi:hypothetical protein
VVAHTIGVNGLAPFIGEERERYAQLLRGRAKRRLGVVADPDRLNVVSFQFPQLALQFN